MSCEPRSANGSQASHASAWGDENLTETCSTAWHAVFETSSRRLLAARPGPVHQGATRGLSGRCVLPDLVATSSKVPLFAHQTHGNRLGEEFVIFFVKKIERTVAEVM